jgi:multidrug efflux pump subunit AcrA (membrane-fusion protein)
MIVDAPNPDECLRPGMTATVVVAGARREHAVRIPSSALSFRPPPDVLAAIDQLLPIVAGNRDDTTMRQVWRFDGAQFTPFAVRVGIADGVWTELVTVRAGDALVTSASVQ